MKRVLFGVFLFGFAANAFSGMVLRPEYAVSRGQLAECFESKKCFIGAHLSNGQRCWVVETDSNGNAIGKYWSYSGRGRELLEQHINQLCYDRDSSGLESTPAPMSIAAVSPEPTPTPTPTVKASPESTPTPMVAVSPETTPTPMATTFPEFMLEPSEELDFWLYENSSPQYDDDPISEPRHNNKGYQQR